MKGITTMNHGVEYEMTINTAMVLKNIMIQNRMDIGSTLSMTSTSFEKRFRIRPSGVVSKNDIGRRIELFSSLLCKSRAARRHPIANTTDVASKATAAHVNKIK